MRIVIAKRHVEGITPVGRYAEARMLGGACLLKRQRHFLSKVRHRPTPLFLVFLCEALAQGVAVNQRTVLVTIGLHFARQHPGKWHVGLREWTLV